MNQSRLSTSPIACSLLALIGSLASSATGQDGRDPWRVQDLLGDDSWLKIHGAVRLRYEGIEGQFRSAARLANSDHLFVQRTRLQADAVFDPATFTFEVLDSRHYGGGSGSALNTTVVNALDILQAHARLDLGELGPGNHHVRAGRVTIDVGSRRLVARNRYRNTINSFTGVDWEWQSDGSAARAFWTMPVRRRPSDLGSVVDNQIELDDQDVDRQFMGGFFSHDVDEMHTVEAYTLTLLENDNRRRRLITPGVRIVRAPARGHFDYQFEAAYQFGHSRRTTTGMDLDHSAWFQHASLGYTFDADWSPRVRVAFDYASGDRDPTDGDNNRFDTLFGARRFEYGPTSLYGAVARSNLSSPDVRLELKPRADTQVMFAWRGVWLSSEQDAWTTSGVADPTGQSGRHVGQQVETRFRWNVIPKSVRLEFGAAHLFHGGFQENAIGGQNTDTTYGYMQAAWQF